MNIVITGHANGIGKTIFNYYNNIPQCKIVGFDLEYKKDLLIPEIYNECISTCTNASHIILNAHTGNQHNMLKELYTLFSDKSKHCIVIGSMMTKHWDNVSDVYSNFNQYWSEKTALDEEVQRIQKIESPFKVTIIRPSWVETDLSKNYKFKKLKKESILQIVKFCIECAAHFHIPTIEVESN